MFIIIPDPFWNRVVHATFHTLWAALSVYLFVKEYSRNAFGKAWMSVGLWWNPSQKAQLDSAIKATERGVTNSPSVWSWEKDPGIQEAIEHIRASYKPDPATQSIPKLPADMETKMSRAFLWRGAELLGTPLVFAGSALCSGKAAWNDWEKVVRGERGSLSADSHEGLPRVRAIFGIKGA